MNRPKTIHGSEGVYKGEHCGMCYRNGNLEDATHKVGEESTHTRPITGHNLTQYLCCSCFREVMGLRCPAPGEDDDGTADEDSLRV